MKASRGATVDEEGIIPDSKSLRVVEESSPSPSPSSLAFENPLHKLANYEDDEEEEIYRKSRARNGFKDGDTGLDSQQNDDRVDEQVSGDDSDSDDEQQLSHDQGRRNRMVEIRRDCPYLDTVNRQVFLFSLWACHVQLFFCSCWILEERKGLPKIDV